MRQLYRITLWGLCLLMGASSLAQTGADPAVAARNLTPLPAEGLAGVGTPFTLFFRIGDVGPVAISGVDANNKMQFVIQLSYCAPTPLGSGTSALSGPLLNYFDITYNPTLNTFDGVQKQNVAIPAYNAYDLNIALEVTQASPVSLTIGGSCTIIPNNSSKPQPTGNDLASIYTHTSVAMPVSLVWFKADAQPDKSVALSWQTSLESGNKGYLVERSKDLKSFEQVGEITDVSANSNTLQTYHFRDANPYRGTSYYRLKQVDLSGLVHTYGAVSVSIDGVYGVYPNPVGSNRFTLSLDEPGSAVLHFYNASGRSVSLEKGGRSEGSVELMPTEKLSTGIYVLQVEERGQIRTHRLVVQ